jgi:glycosyltransferase involved in cell wall biosynthesis
VNGTVDLSVVIPCFNGSAHLGQMLRSLADQRFAGTFEVVIADNGSIDDSLEVCDRFTGQLEIVKVDASQQRGQAYARNVGVEHGAGTKLVFLDQDDEIAPGYISALAAALDKHQFVAARMDFEALNPQWTIEARRSAIASGLLPGLYPWAYGCSLAIRRDCFEAAQRFDQDLPCAEDVDFCWRVRRDLGTELQLVEDAVLRYRLKASYGALFRQGRLYGRGGAALYRKWRNCGMERRSFTEVVRSWGAIAWRLLAHKNPGDRGEAWYLAGQRLGCLTGSIEERVVFL